MKPSALILFGALLCSTTVVAASPNASDGQQKIIWQTFDAPPFMIANGPDANSGVIDGIRELVQREMPSYQHEIKQLPYKRFLAYAKAGKKICTPYLYKNSKREEFMTYSIPAVVFPKVHAIVRKETYENLGRPTHVSLKYLLGNMGYTMSTNKVRSYGDVIDPIIEQFEALNQINRHTGSTTRIFQMVARKRSDFVLDIPSRVGYWTKSLGLEQKNFRTLAVSESSPTMVSYIACPKTPWGEKVIEGVNQVLRENIPKEMYLTYLQRWSTKFHKMMIEHLYQSHLLKPHLNQ